MYNVIFRCFINGVHDVAVLFKTDSTMSVGLRKNMRHIVGAHNLIPFLLFNSSTLMFM